MLWTPSSHAQNSHLLPTSCSTITLAHVCLPSLHLSKLKSTSAPSTSISLSPLLPSSTSLPSHQFVAQTPPSSFTTPITSSRFALAASDSNAHLLVTNQVQVFLSQYSNSTTLVTIHESIFN